MALPACLQVLVGVTPERSRADRQRLAAHVAEAQAAAEAAKARAERAAALLAFEASVAWPPVWRRLGGVWPNCHVQREHACQAAIRCCLRLAGCC